MTTVNTRAAMLLSLLAAACGGADLPLGSDGIQPAADAGAHQGGTIAIYITGDHQSVDYGDGLAGQTPVDYQIAVSRYYTLRSADDPAPALCFDHGSEQSVAEISGDTLVGVCDTSTIPTAAYTHGRTKVEWARYSVAGVYHLLGQAYPVTITVFRAYSDTRYEGRAFRAGAGVLTFDAGTGPVEIPVVFPAMPDVPGVSFETINGEFFMTFIYTRPLMIEQSNEQAHWARFNWRVKDAFRWADRDLPGYSAGVWDLSADVVNSELVHLYGVAGYFVTASTD